MQQCSGNFVSCSAVLPALQGLFHQALLDQFAGTDEASGQAVHATNVRYKHVLERAEPHLNALT